MLFVLVFCLFLAGGGAIYGAHVILPTNALLGVILTLAAFGLWMAGLYINNTAPEPTRSKRSY